MALDGRIAVGDIILDVNGVSFEDFSVDEAIRTLREIVQNQRCAYCICGFEFCHSFMCVTC